MSRAKLQSGSGPVINSPVSSGPPAKITEGPSERRAEIASALIANTKRSRITPINKNVFLQLI